MQSDDVEAKPESDDMLDALWRRIDEDWDSASAHEAFLQAAFDRSELGRAAGRYRSQLGRPERKELAQKKLAAATMLAMQVLDSNKTEPNPKTPRWLIWLAAAVCVGALAVLAYALNA